jgi:K+-sensing histidine kinase KdpD
LLLYFPAILFIALIFGRNTGYFATIFAAFFAALLIIPPIGSLAISPRDAVALLLFAFIGFAISSVIEALRGAIVRLRDSEAAMALLLEESAHRTKNDLAIVSSALTLQSNATSELAVPRGADGSECSGAGHRQGAGAVELPPGQRTC